MQIDIFTPIDQPASYGKNMAKYAALQFPSGTLNIANVAGGISYTIIFVLENIGK